MSVVSRVTALGVLLMMAADSQGTSPATSKPAGGDPMHPRVVLETSKGRIVLELDAEKAPVTVKNFLDYVDAGHYDGTIFHRVIRDFMIQGGGMTPDMREKPTRPPIKNEWSNGLKNTRGTIAMARTNMPDSASSQFFINTVDNARLSEAVSGGAGYAVFGKVVEGMEVVDQIRGVATRTMGHHGDVPVEAVLINSARRFEDHEKAREAR